MTYTAAKRIGRKSPVPPKTTYQRHRGLACRMQTNKVPAIDAELSSSSDLQNKGQQIAEDNTRV